MTQVSSSVFKTNTSTLYADNATGDISAADIRAQMDDMADSASFINAGNSSAPGANDDGVNTGGNGAAKIGDIWVNETSDVGYICLDNSTGAAIWAPMGQLNNVVEDTTPQLGGNLDAQSNNITAVGKIEYADGSNSAPSVTNSGDTDTGMYWPLDDTLAFATGGVERLRLDSGGTAIIPGAAFRSTTTGGNTYWESNAGGSAGNIIFSNNFVEQMRIDSLGNVGIGTSSPAYMVEIENSTGSAQLGLTSSNTGYSELYFGDQTVTNAGALSYDHNNDALRINVSETERMRIDSSGNVLVGTSTSPSGSNQIVASGGIYLGGTNSANLIDDYEEGTWTPSLDRSSSSPSVNYTARDGSYTKIGNVVYISGFINVSSWTSGGGYYLLSGLPFPVVSGAGSKYTQFTSTDIGQYYLSSGYTYVGGYFATGTNYIALIGTGGANVASVNAFSPAATFYTYFSGFYYTS